MSNDYEAHRRMSPFSHTAPSKKQLLAEKNQVESPENDLSANELQQKLEQENQQQANPEASPESNPELNPELSPETEADEEENQQHVADKAEQIWDDAAAAIISEPESQAEVNERNQQESSMVAEKKPPQLTPDNNRKLKKDKDDADLAPQQTPSTSSIPNPFDTRLKRK